MKESPGPFYIFASWEEKTDALAATVADLNIKEGIPVLERRLEKLKAHPKKDIRIQSAIIEVQEAIDVLKGKIKLTPEEIKPLSLKRRTTWQNDLLQEEQHFYDKEEQIDDFDLPAYFDQSSTTSPQWPVFPGQGPTVKESLPGRNDPCHCGSGKSTRNAVGIRMDSFAELNPPYSLSSSIGRL